MDQSKLALLLLLAAIAFVQSSVHPPLCIKQRVPVEHGRICVCLLHKIPKNATLLAPQPPSPAPSPQLYGPSSNTSCAFRAPWNRTSWCMCTDFVQKPVRGNASAPLLITLPRGLSARQIGALFPPKTLRDADRLDSCGKCICPAFPAAAAKPSPRAPSTLAPRVAPPGLLLRSNVCLCTDCTRLDIPPAESPAEAPELPAAPAPVPRPEADGQDWEMPSSNPVSGVVVLRRQPPPRVVITHAKVKQKVLAYVLPVAGFVACVVVFVGVVFGRSLLFWSSSSSSRFSHLESEV